jgi:hypothetical protein
LFEGKLFNVDRSSNGEVTSMSRKRLAYAALPLAAAAFLGGCASGFTTVAPSPSPDYQNLGKTTGSACGSLGILGTAYYFIPMGLNSRVENAYNEAVSKVPSATSLTNVTMQESWYWWVIGTMRCVTITGEAVK